MPPSAPEAYHHPVMVAEVVTALVTDEHGAYLDLTVGGGGHLMALADRVASDARLYGVDKDAEAIAATAERFRDRAQQPRLLHGSFGDLTALLGVVDESRLTGILLDLGVSSHQIDSAVRGFSFQADGPLDMRLDPEAEVTAAQLINGATEQELTGMLRQFGEEPNARRISTAIARRRTTGMIRTTAELASIIADLTPPHRRIKTLARVFQALRIAVNRELDELTAVLPAAIEVLTPGGRLAVISYHSLEDRIVKREFQRQAKGLCSCPPRLPQCACGAAPRVAILTRKPLGPGAAEIETNPRARSARLRVAERLAS